MNDCDAILASARRHLLAAQGRSEETALKLARECKGEVCELKRETRLEAEDALRHLLTAEEDLAELAGRVGADRVREVLTLIDDVRRLRQQLVQTNLPLRAELPVDRAKGERFARASAEVGQILGRLERADLGEVCLFCELDEEAPAAPASAPCPEPKP